LAPSLQAIEIVGSASLCDK
jgi:hypothetical protein